MLFGRRLGFVADERQEEVLRAAGKRVLLACSRQWGKSTVAALKAVHRAWTEPGCLVLVVSPVERQTEEFLLKAEEMVRELGVRVRGDGRNPMSILFPNGSRIVGVAAVQRSVRGYSKAAMVMIDEAAQVPDEVYRALRPVLGVSGGDIWLMSTPYGKQGFFWEAWAGGEEWMRMAVPATECGRIPAEFLEEERRVLGRTWFAQEYLCEFVDNGAGVFDRGVVERAVCGVPVLLLRTEGTEVHRDHRVD